MTIRRLRLAAGLVMLSYLTLHLSMHALGNVSFEAMQWGTRIHDFIWHSVPGTIALYGAFAIHFTLALYALYARRSFRIGAGELVRLVLGFSILPAFVAPLYCRAVCIFGVRCDAPLRRSAHRLFFVCFVLGVAASHRDPCRLDAWLLRRALLARCTIQLS